MDHIRILRRAFEITRFYRALWVFGILVALTAAHGGGNGGGGGSNAPRNGQTPGFPGQFPSFQWPNIPANVLNTIIAAAVTLICVVVILGIAFTILRYLSQTALVRMVDGYENNGERVSVRQGFRLGWSRGAFRTWLADLLFGVIGFVVFILLLLLAAAPLLLWLTHNTAASVIGTVVTIGLGMLLILLLIVVASAVSLWMEMIRREIVLGGKGVMEGIRSGWRMLTRRLGDVIIMGLILFGIGLGLGLLTIPIFFLLAAVGAVAGGLPALLAGGITNIFVHGVTPQIIAGMIGVPIFLVVLFSPLLFLGGLVETFYSATWTLTYRELLTLEAVRVEPPAEPGPQPDSQPVV
jgi:hypothetical protein